MNTLFQSWIVRGFALLLASSAAFAQERVPFRQDELDQMLAPVALYPDSLLSQILMASTYPLEVVQASRWSRANPGVKGQDAVRVVESMDWDPSVKSLTAFPQVLTMMDQKIEWTERLGEAFLAQQADVMDSVQGLRRRAEATGNLRSSEQMRVSRQDDLVYIEQGSPEIVYVPYYNPTVVYGPWWWPAYPPVYWAPFPAYYAGPAYGPGFFWGSGIVISTGFFFGHCDWHRRHVTVVHNHVSVNRTTIVSQPTKVVWQHNPVHRRGVPFRNPDARQRYEQAKHTADARRDAGRSDIARIERRADDNRTAEQRQRRLDDRRNAPQERREGPGDDRREFSGYRSNDNDRGERARPAVRPDARQAQPETRGTPPDRNVRPERSAPLVNDRRGDRSQQNAPRPQARNPEPRPVTAAPVVRPNPAPAPAAPIVRAQSRANPRPAAPMATAPAAPRQTFDSPRRAEVRPDVNRGRQSQSAPAPLPFISGGGHAPRAMGGGQRSHSMGERIR
jgi:uncharacterized protein DUF3300